MIELFKIDGLDIGEQFIPGLHFLIAGQFNNQVTNVKLLQSEQSLDEYLDSSAIQTQHIVIGVLFELFLHLRDGGESSVVDELCFSLAVWADWGVGVGSHI